MINNRVKNILLVINILASPLLAVLFSGLLSTFVPNVIYEKDNTILESMILVGIVSMILSIISAGILVILKSNTKVIITSILLPTILSIILSPVTFSGVAILLYFFKCTTSVC